MRRATAVFATLIACGTTGASLEPGSPAWLDATRARLLQFDADGSGALEEGEVERLPCEAFLRPAREWAEARGTSFAVSHGLGPGLLFRGGPLGFAASGANAVPALEQRCGLAEPSLVDQTTASLTRIESPPTSAAWDARVASILLEGHDLDRSGWLDQNLEIQDIPCEALQEIERQVRSAADVGLATLYGVEDGLVWIGANLGFATEARDALGVRLLVCDVEVDVD